MLAINLQRAVKKHLGKVSSLDFARINFPGLRVSTKRRVEAHRRVYKALARADNEVMRAFAREKGMPLEQRRRFMKAGGALNNNANLSARLNCNLPIRVREMRRILTYLCERFKEDKIMQELKKRDPNAELSTNAARAFLEKLSHWRRKEYLDIPEIEIQAHLDYANLVHDIVLDEVIGEELKLEMLVLRNLIVPIAKTITANKIIEWQRMN